MDDCIFCKITKGEVPSYKVYEDNDFMAFLSIVPLNPGHTLIIPKKHFRWVWDVDNIGEYYEVVGKVANALRKAFGIDLVVSLVVGEEVHHAHVWLIPRFENDGHGESLKTDNVKNLSEEEMKDAAEKIKEALK
ncbi:MAG: HIT family protein [Nanoarchaeota archaeon]|nr:HIT family protein [Nanoarchaeota archaeon]MCG2718942.1 HIT family protein [Nanoarchaeota archaeon]